MLGKQLKKVSRNKEELLQNMNAVAWFHKVVKNYIKMVKIGGKNRN